MSYAGTLNMFMNNNGGIKDIEHATVVLVTDQKHNEEPILGGSPCAVPASTGKAIAALLYR